jgi:hypothetical protein
MLDAGNGEELEIEAYTPKDLIAAQLSIEVAPVKRVENPRTKKVTTPIRTAVVQPHSAVSSLVSPSLPLIAGA